MYEPENLVNVESIRHIFIGTSCFEQTDVAEEGKIEVMPITFEVTIG
jgi:hypothetical protein